MSQRFFRKGSSSAKIEADCIAGFSATYAKYWPPEGFAQSSDVVAEKYDWTPAWTSSPDAKGVQILLETAKLCRVLLPGRLNLAQMSALLSESKFYH